MKIYFSVTLVLSLIQAIEVGKLIALHSEYWAPFLAQDVILQVMVNLNLLLQSKTSYIWKQIYEDEYHILKMFNGRKKQ